MVSTMTEPSPGRVLVESALDLSDHLTAIRACVERARAELGPGPALHELREIERIVSRASLLTGRILAVGRTTRIVGAGEDLPEPISGDETSAAGPTVDDPGDEADRRPRSGESSSAIV